MKPLLRRVSYCRDLGGPLVVHAKSSIIGNCLNQFPSDVVYATRGYRFNTPFEIEALMVAGQHGRDMHGFVVDDLQCRHAMEFMEVFMPNDMRTIHAAKSFPESEPHILTSPVAQDLVELVMDGDPGIYQPFTPDEEMEL